MRYTAPWMITGLSLLLIGCQFDPSAQNDLGAWITKTTDSVREAINPQHNDTIVTATPAGYPPPAPIQQVEWRDKVAAIEKAQQEALLAEAMDQALGNAPAATALPAPGVKAPAVLVTPKRLKPVRKMKVASRVKGKKLRTARLLRASARGKRVVAVR